MSNPPSSGQRPHAVKPGYSVGKVAQGTRYSYTLQGKLVGSGGEAKRKELRPCTATSTKL